MLLANMRAEDPRSISEKEATKNADDREDADFVHDMEKRGWSRRTDQAARQGKEVKDTDQ